MAGSSSTSAPRFSSRVRSSLACSRARVTTTERPNSGRASNHDRSSAATSPTTIALGACTPASATVASVARTVCWSGRVPLRTAATGVSGARPPSIRRWAITARRPAPMRITRVPPTRASASQSTSVRSLAGSSCPVTTVKWVETPRWVTGIPAYAAAPMALVMPGTTSKAMPAAASASASSPPRPNTNGSPPLRRTTHPAVRPRSTRTWLICSWVRSTRPGAFPAGISSAPAGARARSAGDARRSYTTTSARRSSSAPRTVTRPGSPGPAPTR